MCVCVCVRAIGIYLSAGCGVMSHTTTFVFLIIVTFEAVIFFLFTFIMCLTQVCSIVSDETVRRVVLFLLPES